jgi:hypothetical protein
MTPLEARVALLAVMSGPKTTLAIGLVSQLVPLAQIGVEKTVSYSELRELVLAAMTRDLPRDQG